ncbi:MAG: NAD(P)-dependent oxidoreductase [Cyanobacteria bacterium J06560_2]
MTSQKIAVLGLGAMGSRIAVNLISAGYSVTVWNRSSDPIKALVEHGAIAAATPRQAAEQADIVISMVTDNDASKSIWLAPETGALSGFDAHKIAIEMSTLTAQYTDSLAETFTTQKAAFLAAPVVGSRPQAEAKKLICLVGGEANTIAKVQPLLTSISGATHTFETARKAMAIKLAINALFGIQIAALSELLGTLQQQGLSPARVMECLSEIPVTSPAMKGAGMAIVAQKYAPLFPINLVEKDFRYAAELSSSAQLPTTLATQKVYQGAIEKGYGSENITAIAQLFL